jgi:hypothetical protein
MDNLLEAGSVGRAAVPGTQAIRRLVDVLKVLAEYQEAGTAC